MAATPTVQPTLWERTKGYSNTAYTKALKPGFDKAYNVVDKLGAPVNRLSNRVGSEAFWPTTMDKESDKAARILRGFCKDGFYENVDESQAKRIENRDATAENVPQGTQRVLKKIPQKVIREAKGLAIFTTMRTGWLLGGSGGSGVLIARHPNTGEWSPPSGIQTQNLSFGFLAGVDIYDTVLIINSYSALQAFTKVRATLGTEIGVAAGPVGIGGSLDTEVLKRQSPIWSYVKSRGLYAGVALEGNLVIERTDENAKFYGQEGITAREILEGKVRAPPWKDYQMLMETVKAAQGDEVDESLLPDAGQSPSDMELVLETGSFGVPDHDDPDPYGVKALEAEGLNIREAGTHQRPSAEVFEFKPAPSSPIYNQYKRQSVDGSIRSKAWRGSTHSLDRGTQTDDEEIKSISHSPRIGSGQISPPRKESQNVEESESPREKRDSESDLDSEPEIHTAMPMVTRARVVSVPKRIPPALPPRNPERVGSPLAEQSPPTDGFDQIALNGTSDENPKSVATATDVSEPELSEKKDVGDISRTTSHGADDKFESIPPTPDEEKVEEKTSEGVTSSVQA